MNEAVQKRRAGTGGGSAAGTADAHRHQVLDSAPDAYVALTDAALIVDCNRAAEKLFGWSREDMLGALATELIPHTLNHESLTAPASLTGGSPRLIGTVWRRDGTDLQVEVVVWRTDDGDRSLWHCLCRDISGRISRLHSLAAHADRLDEAQRMAGVGSWDWDLETGQTQWSSNLYAIVGLDPRRPVSMDDLLSRLHAPDRSVVIDILEAGLRDGGSHSFQARLDCSDGTQRWLECRGEVWLNSDGEAVRAAGTFQDVTSAKGPQARGEAEQPLLAAFEQSSIGFFLFRADTGIFRINDAMGAMLGTAPEQLLGIDPRRFPYLKGAKIAAAFTEMLDGDRDSMTMNGAVLRPDGSTVRVAAHAVTVPACDAEPGYVLAQWCDMTPREVEDAEPDPPLIA